MSKAWEWDEKGHFWFRTRDDGSAESLLPEELMEAHGALNEKYMDQLKRIADLEAKIAHINAILRVAAYEECEKAFTGHTERMARAAEKALAYLENMDNPNAITKGMLE